MADKLHYAENGVYQCWTCKNKVGQKEYVFAVKDVYGFDQEICFLFPECKVAGCYMTWTTRVPCEKYCPKWRGREEG